MSKFHHCLLVRNSLKKRRRRKCLAFAFRVGACLQPNISIYLVIIWIYHPGDAKHFNLPSTDSNYPNLLLETSIYCPESNQWFQLSRIQFTIQNSNLASGVSFTVSKLECRTVNWNSGGKWILLCHFMNPVYIALIVGKLKSQTVYCTHNTMMIHWKYN